MKSIAYTLSVLFLAATFAHADAPSESKASTNAADLKAPTTEVSAKNNKAPTSGEEIEEVQILDVEPTESSSNK